MDKLVIPPGANSVISEGAQERSSSGPGESKQLREKNLRKACADFESIFISQLFKTMRSTVPSGGPLSKMSGKETYEMMMDQKVSEELANKGGLGLQKVLFDQLNRPDELDK